MCLMTNHSVNTSCSDYPDMANFSYIEYYFNSDIEIDSILRNARQRLLPVLKPVTLILSLIGIIGIVGNILVILVFSRTFQKQASTYLVLMLAITDLIACSLVIPGTLLKEWFVNFQNDIMCKVAELLRHFVIISSAMILVAIAFDRFWMVHKRATHDNHKRLTLVMMLIIVAVALSFAVPSMLRVGVYRLLPNGKLININICAANDLLISVSGYKIHWNIITALFSLLLLTIIILYTLIFIMVYKHRNKNLGHQGLRRASNLQTTSANQHNRVLSLLPFVGPNPTMQQKSKLSTRVKHPQIAAAPSSKKTWSRLNKIMQVLHPHKQPDPDQIVQINIINHSSSSSITSLSDLDNKIKMETRATNASPCNLKPSVYDKQGSNLSPGKMRKLLLEKQGTSLSQSKMRTNPAARQETNITNKQGTSLSPYKLTNSPSTRQGINTLSPHSLAPSLHHVTINKALLPLSQRTAHIKTTQVLCIITMVYIAAFLPMFLITHEVISNNMIVFYLYFINNAANPIIYSFMNRKFRQEIWKMFHCKRGNIWPVG